ncbi:hypothetical protein J4Q44_G00155870 [Coregonus suidteri]|uniref:Uncharacterized protein n=1 Tax=Coregonus suidteri TaxID=861788 RepID=A0AAN8LK82_9TELE
MLRRTSKDSYTCVIVERGYLVLQRRQDNQVLKAKSTGKVSLNNLLFTIVMDTQFEVHVVHGEETEIVKMDYKKESFRTFYIGGLPASLRESVMDSCSHWLMAMWCLTLMTMP